MLGPTIADVVQQFAKLTGSPPLMPFYSLGYLGSTMSYTEAPNAQEKLCEFVDLCKEHKSERDCFVL